MKRRYGTAVVTRLSGAIDKASPVANRIWSEMRSQALLIARKQNATAPLDLDTTPLTLGIEGADGRVVVILRRGDSIPAQVALSLPKRDNQLNVIMKIVQGEDPVAINNRFVAEYEISESPSANGDERHIRVIFNIDANGLLHVSARGVVSGKNHNVHLKTKGEGLSEDEIQRLQREADRNQRK